MAEIVKALGHPARFLTDPSLAEGAIAEFQPHVVFLDIRMPGIDGWSLAKKIRAGHGQAIKLVAITAFAHADAYASSRKAGFDAHVVKPIDPDLVDSILQQVFGEPKRLS